MTARDLALEIFTGFTPMLRCELVGDRVVVETPFQQFLVTVQENKDWRPNRDVSARTSSPTTSATKKA